MSTVDEVSSHIRRMIRLARSQFAEPEELIDLGALVQEHLDAFEGSPPADYLEEGVVVRASRSVLGALVAASIASANGRYPGLVITVFEDAGSGEPCLQLSGGGELEAQVVRLMPNVASALHARVKTRSVPNGWVTTFRFPPRPSSGQQSEPLSTDEVPGGGPQNHPTAQGATLTAGRHA